MKGIYFQRTNKKENLHVNEYKSLYINFDQNMWYLITWMSLHWQQLKHYFPPIKATKGRFSTPQKERES